MTAKKERLFAGTLSRRSLIIAIYRGLLSAHDPHSSGSQRSRRGIRPKTVLAHDLQYALAHFGTDAGVLIEYP